MKKDIPIHKVEDLAIAIVPRDESLEDKEELWDVFLINLKEEPITCVLVNSTGYSEQQGGEQRRTTTLRHFFEEVGPLSVVQVEPIQVQVFDLTNEYWVSFLHDNYMYDKKYVFVRGSIRPEHFMMVPFINRKGVVIR
ncbi:MAG TPA: hypothetical protein PLL53_15340 [Saprospiraceae bacterium]|nr:hypothetical protein [Saprospiraceae bacterium]